MNIQRKIERVALDVYFDYQGGDCTATDYHSIEDKLSLAGLSDDYVDAVYHELRNVFGLNV